MTPAQSTVEYGLLISTIAIIVLVVANLYGSAIAAWFGTLGHLVTVAR